MVSVIPIRHIYKLCVLFCILLALIKPNNAANTNVVKFGARPDGRTDSTQAFQKAWAFACRSSKPTTINVPRGKFVVQPIRFSGPCRSRITFRIKGTILGPSDYRVLARSNVWLTFFSIKGLTIEGGTLDARGHSFWSCRRRFGYCNKGAQSISFVSCNNVIVRGLKSFNSQKSHMSIKNCNHLTFSGLTLRAPSGSPNTDGINIQHSKHVTIYGSVIKTGDDCIALGPGTQHTVINKIACGPGHGISIGSMGNSLREEGVQNVVVTNVGFWKTTNGVRIKSWARPSNSFVRDITFRNLNMYNVFNPIIIDQKYCPNNQCPHQASGVKISNVEYINVKGVSKSKDAIIFSCSPSNPCRGIRLEDVRLTFGKRPATSSCSNVHGSSGGKVSPRSCI